MDTQITKTLRELSAFDIAVITAIKTGVPMNFIGSPGASKTGRLESITTLIDGVYMVPPIVAGSLDPTEVRGFPKNNNSYSATDSKGRTFTGRMEYSPPHWALECLEVQAKGLIPILFFDEVNTATPSVQAALLRPLNEGYVGELCLGNTVRIAASNARGQSSGFQLSQAMVNRFCNVKVLPPINDWMEWAMDIMPPKLIIKEQRIKYKTILRSFIELLILGNNSNFFLHEGESTPTAEFTSRRSLTHLSKIYAFLASNSIPVDVAKVFTEGLIDRRHVDTALHVYQKFMIIDPTMYLTDTEVDDTQSANSYIDGLDGYEIVNEADGIAVYQNVSRLVKSSHYFDPSRLSILQSYYKNTVVYVKKAVADVDVFEVPEKEEVDLTSFMDIDIDADLFSSNESLI